MDYQPNSHRFKEEQANTSTEERKKVEKVVTGMVTTKKKSEASKFVQLFISEDAPKIKTYVVHDIIIPAFKKAVMGTIDMLLNGGHSSGYSSEYSSSAPKVRYSKYSDDSSYRKTPGTVQARSRFEYDDIAFPSRGAAERVLSTMEDIYAEYKSVTLAEMYELAGLEHPYTYTKYGWMSLRDADIVRRGESYFIKLPAATLITN